MTVSDVIIILLLATAVFFAVRHMIKKKGACNCGSTSCPHSKNYNK